jgi:hypothetical protein
VADDLQDNPYGAPLLSPSGQSPQGFIIHHTGGRGGPQNVVDDWRKNRPGIGSQYIVDRDGRLYQTNRDLGYSGTNHMINGYGPQGTGLSNRNTVGVEVVARHNGDVNDAQEATIRGLVGQNYPNVPVYGHGEVNPGHRESDEGMRIVNAIRADRSGQPATQLAGQPQPTDQPGAAAPAPGLLTPPAAQTAMPTSAPSANPITAFLSKLTGSPPPAPGAGLPQAGPTQSGTTLDAQNATVAAAQKAVDRENESEGEKQSKQMMALAQQLMASGQAPQMKQMSQLTPFNTGPVRPLPLNLPPGFGGA